MGFFTKSSLTFFTINFLRLLSVVAILLALSAEVVVMVRNVSGVKAAAALASTTTNPSTTHYSYSTPAYAHARRDIRAPPVSTMPTPTSSPIPVRTASAASTAAPSLTNSGASAAALSGSDDSTCSYIGNTDVQKEVGGLLFSTLERIFCCLLLIAALFAEMPPPSQWTQRFWNYAFPPFGEEFGSGVLGGIQVFLGCSILSHGAHDFPLGAGWFLFVIGFLNMLFGLAYGARIKSLRSIFSLPGSSALSGLSALKNSNTTSTPASQYISPPCALVGTDLEKGERAHWRDTNSFVTGGRKVGIVIGAPIRIPVVAQVARKEPVYGDRF